MRLAFAVVLIVHGLIHLLGFAKAFELAELPQLTRPIAAATGTVWLAAALLFLLTAGALFVWPRWWWAVGAVAIAVSMAAIVPSWADAKFGALANLIVLVGVVFGFLTHGPISLLVPFQVLHRYVSAAATMRVKVGGLVSVVDMSGPEMTEAETVTLFNDMCILAPATLIDPAITWAEADAQTVRASFTIAAHTIRAELVFNESGELTNFWSDDRRRASADGQTLDAVRWSTPVGSYRSFGPARLASRGEGRWHEAGGEYAYLELELNEVEYNVPAR